MVPVQGLSTCSISWGHASFYLTSILIFMGVWRLRQIHQLGYRGTRYVLPDRSALKAGLSLVVLLVEPGEVLLRTEDWP